MKKIVLFVLLVGMLCFTACGNGETSDNKKSAEKQEQHEEDVSESQKEENLKEELVMEIPEEFTSSETEQGYIMYQKEGDLSNIICTQVEGEGDLSLFDGDKMIEQLEESLIEVGEESPNVILHDESWYKIDGHEAYRVEYSYDIFGEERRVCSVVIENGDVFESITFTNKVVEDYGEIFAEIEESIHFEKIYEQESS